MYLFKLINASAFSRYIPRSGIAGSYGSSILVFQVFSTVAAPIYIPTKSVPVLGFPFLHFLSNTFFFVDILMIAILTGVR